ncbi:MAG: hypothetical protein H6669_15705 [Ardenticatenaceae bacterium]|nr:hypothetical protein [Ardenticatenaceae bacterium]
MNDPVLLVICDVDQQNLKAFRNRMVSEKKRFANPINGASGKFLIAGLGNIVPRKYQRCTGTILALWLWTAGRTGAESVQSGAESAR